MNKPEPKYPVGTRVKIINEAHRNGEVGYVEKVKEIAALNDFKCHSYYVKFKGGAVSSFFEENIKAEPCTAHLKKKRSLEYTSEAIKNIGAVSSVFAEARVTAFEFYKESADASSIRAVTHEDVTSKHVINWFFKLENWVGNDPDPALFPFHAITHNANNNDRISVYGYFDGNKLDGMIRVDEFEDSYELSFFCVNESVQQQGIGQCLLQYVLEKFNDKKLILRVYTGNENAIHIYKKYGFKIIESGYGCGYYPKLKHYVMQKDIR